MTDPDPDYGRQLGQRIAQARAAVNLDQTSLATVIGVAHVTASRYESGQRVPSPATLAHIATATGVDPGWLLTGELAGIPVLARFAALTIVPRCGPGCARVEIATTLAQLAEVLP